MIEPLSELQSILVCPRSGAALVRSGAYQFSVEGHPYIYDFVGEHPVLVDFRTSVLDDKSVANLGRVGVLHRRRRAGLGVALKRLVSPSGELTKKNVADLIAVLKSADANPRVLVIGGGTVGEGMSPLYEDPDIRVIGFDIYASTSVQLIADAHSIPLQASSVDGVVIQAVLEHVLEPTLVVSEIHRVLRPDGVVYAETPFLQPVHEAAYDFTRFTESGHRYLFRDFDEISAGALHGIADQLLRSIEYFGRGLFRSRRIGKAIKLLFSWLHLFDKIIPAKFAIDAASAVFFFGRKSADRISPKEAVSRYKGAE